MVRRMGKSVFWGDEPRRCICTNASRGLSAMAEFLVKVAEDTNRQHFRDTVCICVCVTRALQRCLTGRCLRTRSRRHWKCLRAFTSRRTERFWRCASPARRRRTRWRHGSASWNTATPNCHRYRSCFDCGRRLRLRLMCGPINQEPQI